MQADRAFLVLGLASFALATTASAGQVYDLGRPATPDEIARWNIDIDPAGAGLPPGAGSVREGAAVYARRCAACLGDRGQGGPMDRLAGGAGTIGTSKPVKTVGSFWPYATTLYDYVRRAMPFDAPQSLSPADVYAVCAYVLFLNGLVTEDAVLDARSLLQVRMPNQHAFVSGYPSGSP